MRHRVCTVTLATALLPGCVAVGEVIVDTFHGPLPGTYHGLAAEWLDDGCNTEDPERDLLEYTYQWLRVEVEGEALRVLIGDDDYGWGCGFVTESEFECEPIVNRWEHGEANIESKNALQGRFLSRGRYEAYHAISNDCTGPEGVCEQWASSHYQPFELPCTSTWATTYALPGH